MHAYIWINFMFDQQYWAHLILSMCLLCVYLRPRARTLYFLSFDFCWKWIQLASWISNHVFNPSNIENLWRATTKMHASYIYEQISCLSSKNACMIFCQCVFIFEYAVARYIFDISFCWRMLSSVFASWTQSNI